MMKYRIFILVSICFLLTACSDDPDNNLSANNDDKHFSCDIDEVSFTFSGTGVYALKDFDEPGTTRVYGTPDPSDTNAKLFSIKIDDSSDLDTEYELDEDNFVVFLNDGENQYASLPVVNGEGFIKITERTETEIAGEFSCSMGNVTGSGEMITISNGTFNVLYR